MDDYAFRRHFEWSAYELGIALRFVGDGINQLAVVNIIEGRQSPPAVRAGQTIVLVDPRYFRPTEVETLLSDASTGNRKLGRTPLIFVLQICREMVESGVREVQRRTLPKADGYPSNLRLG